MKTKIINFFKIFTPLILGSLVGVIINTNIDYNTLTKPPLSPPSILFPIMWSIIYFLYGLSYYLYKKENSNNKVTFLYYLNLFLNLLWSIIFFTLKLRLLSIFWITAIIVTLILLLTEYKKTKELSFYLNIPYLIWLLFATYLNIGIYILN